MRGNLVFVAGDCLRNEKHSELPVQIQVEEQGAR